jgi:type VI secretion system secreted protein VgrG
MTPHRATKRPRIEGTQVAIVAGPAGEEIHPQLSDSLMTF